MRAHLDDDLELQLAKIALIALVILWFALPFLTARAEAQTLSSAVPKPTFVLEKPGPFTSVAPAAGRV